MGNFPEQFCGALAGVGCGRRVVITGLTLEEEFVPQCTLYWRDNLFPHVSYPLIVVAVDAQDQQRQLQPLTMSIKLNLSSRSSAS
jgi:hypothetical protein